MCVFYSFVLNACRSAFVINGKTLGHISGLTDNLIGCLGLDTVISTFGWQLFPCLTVKSFIHVLTLLFKKDIHDLIIDKPRD